jgi:hypothetical protein
MINAARATLWIFKSYSADESMYLIAKAEQVFSQIAPVLPGNSCYESFLPQS